GEQPLEGGSIEIGTGETAIVVAVADQQPAFRFLARHIGLAGLALRVEAVELLLEAFLGRFARVDRAAPFADHRLCHGRPRWQRSPKKSGPFHRVPVMARAMAESD